MNRTFDALVVGGGLAGAAVAHDLAAAGRRVALVERERGPHHKVCGEFLSFEALHYLDHLGVDPLELGAVPIEMVSIAGAGQPAECKLPFPALGLSRYCLDEALLGRAQGAGAFVIRGTSVEDLARTRGGWTTRLSNGEALDAAEVFAATGKHDLRRHRRPAGRQNDLIGFKLHFRLKPEASQALERRVELFLFPGGYGGLQPVENGLANLCLLVRKPRFRRSGNRWDQLLADILRACPHLEARLDRAEPLADHPLAVAAIPYGFVRQTSGERWHLGDQGAVIPSFCGEGMSIALHSGRLAARYCLAGHSAERFQHQLAADVGLQVRRSTRLSRLLVHGWAQRIGVPAVRLHPRLLAAVATSTRIARDNLS